MPLSGFISKVNPRMVISFSDPIKNVKNTYVDNFAKPIIRNVKIVYNTYIGTNLWSSLLLL